jgi:acetyltransferase-like isoleucine patch superfamily enzyme
MSLGRSVHIERGAVINCVTAYRGEKYSPELTIGDNTLINVDVHIGCARRIFIGNDVVTSARCQIIDHHHGYQDLETPVAEQKLTIKGPIVIEDQCWLATGVVVCSGVRIGRHSIIGANSVVTHDIPPCSLAAGAPARVIRPLAPRVSGKE